MEVGSSFEIVTETLLRLLPVLIILALSWSLYAVMLSRRDER